MKLLTFIACVLLATRSQAVTPVSECPAAQKFGAGPPSEALCPHPSDPNKLPASKLESWFTKEIFADLFPFSNLGWGPTACWPYSYEALVIAARYFPQFGTSSPNTVYTAEQNYKRDVAAFAAHAVQETGENNAFLYNTFPVDKASDCFYRGGFYNWFEGGPTSSFLDPNNPGYKPEDGLKCNAGGKYCADSPELQYFFPCRKDDQGCYFGRGAIQISYNFNYGLFDQFLKSVNINVDLLQNPNLVMTKMDPPLGIMASLWFYMTPQPPKPAMHDIVLGSWNSGDTNKAAGYTGPIFGPTSLIINNECNGEDASEPGGAGESRRIKAFKWFTKYFGVPAGDAKTLTCKDMPQQLDQIQYNYSWQPDWQSTWKDEPCNCAPASYGGMIPYFDPAYYSEYWSSQNEANRVRCVKSIYDNPAIYSMVDSPCLKYPAP